MPKTTETYSLDPEFERAVAYLAATNPKFWGQVGYALDADGLNSPEARMIVQAVHAIAKELSKGPESTLTVIQYLNILRQDGKATRDEILAANDYFDAAEDGEIPPADEAILVLGQILRKRASKNALEKAMDVYGNQGDLGRMSDEIERAARIGIVDLSPGVKVGMGSFSEIEKMRGLQRMPTGIMELDVATDGGLLKQGLGTVIGGTGGGKSMMLIQIACNSLVNFQHIAFATLELPEPMQISRIKANLTGLPINALMQGSLKEAKSRMSQLSLGNCFVKYFTADATTVSDIEQWLDYCEEYAKCPVDLLIVDYADRLGVEKSKSDYDHGKIVYQGLRNLAVDKDMWCWTASQPQRKKDRRMIDTDDVADSMHKVRIADLVVTVNPQEDEEQLEFFVAKNRVGRSKVKVGPFPHDFACARIAPVLRREPWNQNSRGVEKIGANEPNERLLFEEWEK